MRGQSRNGLILTHPGHPRTASVLPVFPHAPPWRFRRRLWMQDVPLFCNKRWPGKLRGAGLRIRLLFRFHHGHGALRSKLKGLIWGGASEAAVADDEGGNRPDSDLYPRSVLAQHGFLVVP